jgi:hypothetical protein
VDLRVASLPTGTPLDVPVTVVHGRKPGPRLWLSAALHGDELNGIEIIRRVLEFLRTKPLRGTLLAAHVVNVFGFIQQSRYLPDRRDLNRSFPGSPGGSLAARIAHFFRKEVVERATHGIDLHTGSLERENMPQVRANLDDPEVERLAHLFGAPALLHTVPSDGTLRAAAAKLGIPAFVYEAGEPRRLGGEAVDVGVRGVLRVMRALDMTGRKGAIAPKSHGEVLRSSSWIRARRAGMLRLGVRLGARVNKNQPLGVVADPYGHGPSDLRAPFAGLVIGKSNTAIVQRGDAVVHLGRLER